jgi:hypothetical protein
MVVVSGNRQFDFMKSQETRYAGPMAGYPIWNQTFHPL